MCVLFFWICLHYFLCVSVWWHHPPRQVKDHLFWICNTNKRKSPNVMQSVCLYLCEVQLWCCSSHILFLRDKLWHMKRLNGKRFKNLNISWTCLYTVKKKNHDLPSFSNQLQSGFKVWNSIWIISKYGIFFPGYFPLVF